jgi:Major Facilitator Superfamily
VSRARSGFLSIAVAVAFADSSIVVLALPQLYGELDTSIVGVSWIITTFNLAVAASALSCLVLLRRAAPRPVAGLGLVVFLVASLGCGSAGSLAALVTWRAVQGIGGGLVLVASLPLLAGLTGSRREAVARWTSASTLGLAAGPALGGLLTQLADWRAIFVVQAPVAALGLLGLAGAQRVLPPAEAGPRRTVAPNLALLLLSGALVGALFLAVLLLVTVWGLGPLAGGIVVSALPAAALLTRRLAAERLDLLAGGTLLLAAGLGALALLPASSALLAAAALALCGAGIGLVLPPLAARALAPDRLAANAAISVGVRHVGLVLALAAVAPLLSDELTRGAERATLNASAVILDAPLPLRSKVPIVLGLRDELDAAPTGEIPDLSAPFEKHGAGDDPAVAAVRDDLVGSVEAALTRSFRSSFALAALLALVAALPAALARRPAA